MVQNTTKISNQLVNINKSQVNFNVPTISYCCLNNKDWSMKLIDGPCYEMLNCHPDELIANKISFGQLIFQKEIVVIWQNVQAALKNRTPCQLIYHIKTPSNVEKTLFEQGQGVYINEELIELRGFISDITSKDTIKSVNITNLFDEFTNDLMQLMENKFGEKVKYNLSRREIEVWIYMCKGMTMKETGNQLNISSRTVEMHINNLKRKLQCYTKSELKTLFFKTSAGKKIITTLY